MLVLALLWPHRLSRRGPAVALERFELYRRTMTTVESYVARPGASRLILFRADGMMAPGEMDLSMGWDRLAAATEAHLIADTDHASLPREPALDRLVEILEGAFAADAQAAASSGLAP